MLVFMLTIPVMGSALLYRRNSEQGTLSSISNTIARRMAKAGVLLPCRGATYSGKIGPDGLAAI
jgi:hypothetical protein